MDARLEISKSLSSAVGVVSCFRNVKMLVRMLLCANIPEIEPIRHRDDSLL